MRTNIHIMGVCGSLEDDSKTLKLLRPALQGASRAGAGVSVFNLRDYQIPLFNSPHTHPKSAAHVENMRQRFKRADGLILATPEYHGSFTGALKNAMDWMGFDEFEGKMVGLVGIAGGSLGAINALNHLRGVCRQVHAWVVPSQVSVAHSHEAFDKSGNLKDPELSKRLRQLGAEVAGFALLHNHKKWKDFVNLWEKSIQNPGGSNR